MDGPESGREWRPRRAYGDPGPKVVVLHGGPGASGSAGPLARALADQFQVLEPWQRWSSDVPLTVDRHIGDLADVIARHAPGERPALVGHSWGAMLGLAFAARYPRRVAALALIGCGTFDREARAQLQQALAQRTTPQLRAQLADLEACIPDAGERAAESHRICDVL